MEAAEKLKITAENLNSMLTTSLKKISDTRKRIKKLKAVSILRRRRKKQEKKLEIPSEFKKSTKRINKFLPSGLGKNMLTSIVELISLLLVGVAINNIGELKERLDKLKVGLDKNVKFLKGIVDNVTKGTRGFISLFESEDREKQFKQVEEKVKDIEKIKDEQLEVDKLIENLRKEYEIVKKRFDNAEGGQVDFNVDDLNLNKTGTLSTGEAFEINDETGKIEITTSKGEKKTFNLEEFIKKNQQELPNIFDLNKDLISRTGDFKMTSNTDNFIASLDLLSTFNEEEINDITYVFTEVKT